MSRITLLLLLTATTSLSCASGTRWARLNTPYGEFAVDTTSTKVIADGLVETWIKEVDRNPQYTYLFVSRTESETQIELDCINLLMRPKRANYWVDHRRVAGRRAHNAARMWTELRDPVSFDNRGFDRAQFLYTHACEGTAAAGYVTVDNQNPRDAVISLYYRGNRIWLGAVAAGSQDNLAFSCPSSDFQFIVDLGYPTVPEQRRLPEKVPCHLTEHFFAEPGDTVSFVVTRDLDQQPANDVCPRP
jgi:hypothetical protein